MPQAADTLVLLMGGNTLGVIMQRLKEAGKAADTPVSIFVCSLGVCARCIVSMHAIGRPVCKYSPGQPTRYALAVMQHG